MIGRAGRPGQPQTPSRRASPAAGWIIELSSTGPGWHDSDVTRTVTEYGHGAGGLQVQRQLSYKLVQAESGWAGAKAVHGR